MDHYNKTFILTLFGMLLFFSSFSIYASIPASGQFKATNNCEAYQSFRKKTNPDSVQLIAGEKYEIKTVNKSNFDWIQVYIPNAKPTLRWINKSCGTISAFIQTKSNNVRSQHSLTKSTKSCSTLGDFDSYVLAVTWQPGFCEHFKYKGDKPECTAINNGKLKITHLTLHGLWPNKASCGKNYGYCDPNARLNLSQSTIDKIAPWMPNFYYQTKFGEYQWKKHGTCQTQNANQYFLTSTQLVKKVDDSAIGEFIENNIGRSVSVSNFKQNLTNNFGQDAVKRISLYCSGGRYLNEIRLNIPKNFSIDSPIKTLLDAGPQGKSFSGNCGKTIYIEDSGK